MLHAYVFYKVSFHHFINGIELLLFLSCTASSAAMNCSSYQMFCLPVSPGDKTILRPSEF